MNLPGLLDSLASDPALRAVVEAVGAPTLDLSAPPGLRPFLLAALADRGGRPVLAVTATSREAEDLVTSLRSLLPDDSVVDYPAW
jgi:transcription-repair coupling factor (superfamily II helicase)